MGLRREPGGVSRYHGAQGGKSGDTGRGSHSLVLARIYPHQLQVKSVATVALKGDEYYPELCLQRHMPWETPIPNPDARDEHQPDPLQLQLLYLGTRRGTWTGLPYSIWLPGFS